MDSNENLLKKQNTLLLLVDLQKSMLNHCVAGDRVEKNTSILIDIARILKIPIIFSEQNPQRLGPFLSNLTGMVSRPQVFAKNEFGCFDNGKINRFIAESGRKFIVIAGIETHICIFQTGAGGIRQGYGVHVISDAVSASSQINHEVGLRRLEKSGCVISSTEMVIFELLGRADTPEFKEALPPIKSIVK